MDGDTQSFIGAGGMFPSTHWSRLAVAKDPGADEYDAVIDFFIRRYWKPVYCYLRRRGHKSEDAKDLTQEFFTHWLEEHIFGRADQARGRFRAFLVSSLDHFVSNKQRDARAGKRRPKRGIVSIDDLCSKEDLAFEPVDKHTPQEIFNRVWGRELLQRVLRLLEQECIINKRRDLYDLFCQRIVKPTLEGTPPPPLAELARKLGLTAKEAGNRVIAVRRAFQRLLRKEIEQYATSKDEVAEEVRDLFRFLSDP